MDYWKQYEVLVAHARENPSALPGENHHVVPRSIHRFTPSTIAVNAPENMVFLSHQQHLMAHYLLWRIWGDRGPYGVSMAAAFRLMMDLTKAKPTPQQLDEYANAKEAQIRRLRLRTGAKHPSSIKVRSLKTGDIYDSMSIASQSLGYCATTVTVICHRGRESMLNGEYRLGSKSQWLIHEEDFQELLKLAGLTESSLSESIDRKTPSFHRTWGYLLRKHNPTWLLNS
jgi:hypothetical protein